MNNREQISSFQKIIKIGNSYGVTLPANNLKRAGYKLGEEVEVKISPRTKIKQQQIDEITKMYEILTDAYKKAIDNLTK